MRTVATKWPPSAHGTSWLRRNFYIVFKWKKKVPPEFLVILVFIFWNSKIGKVGQNGPKNSFEKVILKCFFKKRQKNSVFSFLRIFVYFVGSRRQLSKGKSFLQKSEKLFQREWRLKMILFAEKNTFFTRWNAKMQVSFSKNNEKTLFSATSLQSLFKAIEPKSDTKKTCFLLFFSNFFQIFLTTLHFKSRSFSLFWVFRHNNLLNLNPESLRNPENWGEIEHFLQKSTILNVFSHFLWDILKCFRKKRSKKLSKNWF